MQAHVLKCWPEHYHPIVDGSKKCEVRIGSDRKYEEGDWIILREWDPQVQLYTGNTLPVRITHVLHGPPLLPKNTWVLSIAPYSERR